MWRLYNIKSGNYWQAFVPERSKGVDLRSTGRHVLAGSNPVECITMYFSNFSLQLFVFLRYMVWFTPPSTHSPSCLDSDHFYLLTPQSKTHLPKQSRAYCSSLKITHWDECGIFVDVHRLRQDFNKTPLILWMYISPPMHYSHWYVGWRGNKENFIFWWYLLTHT